MFSDKTIEGTFEPAKQRYADLGVDVDGALSRLSGIAISLHCWQGDDVGGFENNGEEIGGGLAVTGSYPGKARTPDELRSDLEKAYSLIPGTHRLNLHACYGEFHNGPVERDEIGPEHFHGWMDWAKQQGISLDFNPTYFAHEKTSTCRPIARSATNAWAGRVTLRFMPARQHTTPTLRRFTPSGYAS